MKFVVYRTSFEHTIISHVHIHITVINIIIIISYYLNIGKTIVQYKQFKLNNIGLSYNKLSINLINK